MDLDEYPTEGRLESLSEADFVQAWRRMVGEPPAVMLADRRDMLAILAETIAPAPAPRGTSALGSRRAGRSG